MMESTDKPYRMIPATPVFAPEVSAAIPEVMKGIKRLPKAEKNTYDNYVFTSIDAYLEFMNPLLAEAGLSIAHEEDEPEFYVNKKDSLWMRGKFRIWLVHTSGAASGPFTRRVAVPMTGAQSYGSAQSYVLKQFLRATFMVPTGERDDADANAQDPHQTAPKAKPAATQAAATAKPAPDLKAKLLASLKATADEDLSAWKKGSSADLATLKVADAAGHREVVDAALKRHAEIKARVEVPLQARLQEDLDTCSDSGQIEAVIEKYQELLLAASVTDEKLYDEVLQPMIEAAQERVA